MGKLTIGGCTRFQRCFHRRRPRLVADGGTAPAIIADGANLPLSALFGSQPSPRSFWTLSFSGAGHLLPYHLGAAKILLSGENGESLPIESVSGSSSGAIAATVTAWLPHRLDEFADRFLQDRGHAFRNLKGMLQEEEEEAAAEASGMGKDHSRSPLLSICTTRCSDGGIHLFSFDGRRPRREQHERLLKSIEASCRIPRSFHPIDMAAGDGLLSRLLGGGSGGHGYPENEGVEIDGAGYADGGIAGPFPPTPLDGDPGCAGRIVVSPVSGEYFYRGGERERGSAGTLPPLLLAIRPGDASRRVPLVGPIELSGSPEGPTASGVGSGGDSGSDPSTGPLLVEAVGVRAEPSIQNLRALVTALGVVPSGPPRPADHGVGGSDTDSGVLRDWMERGQADAHEALIDLQTDRWQ